ncbi:nematode fatty acid retinoid binding protein [Ancylostoma ceylanicum]|uniref:Fatty-acid and retinol-binding protein 1 n=1 Tax=Ancylostoma ceylanicum TaxID=53326 RepID=A0A0D6LK33_9BILA|nr:nematode fatty acid retinoid binding protein [Ancylostoma ceylanicum]
MFWRIVATVVVLWIALGSALDLGKIPAQHKELVPGELKHFVTNLSDADVAVLVELNRNSTQYNSEEEIMAALKAKSPSTAAKIEKLQALVDSKVAALEPEAKTFAEEFLFADEQLAKLLENMD